MGEAGRFDLSTLDGFPAFWHSLSSWIWGFRSRYTHLQSVVLEELSYAVFVLRCHEALASSDVIVCMTGMQYIGLEEERAMNGLAPARLPGRRG